MQNILENCDYKSRMSGDERRDQILHTAMELFSRHGFKGTTTKMIAEASGVSEAMVFRHFATKDELYGAIIHHQACGVGEGEGFPWEQCPELMEAWKNGDDFGFFFNMARMAMTKHREDVAFMRLLMYSALEEHELADRFFREFVSSGYDFIGGYIERRQKEGAFRKVNPRIVVRAFMGMLIHHSLNDILWDRKRTLLDADNDEVAREFAKILIDGIRN